MCASRSPRFLADLSRSASTTRSSSLTRKHWPFGPRTVRSECFRTLKRNTRTTTGPEKPSKHFMHGSIPGRSRWLSYARLRSTPTPPLADLALMGRWPLASLPTPQVRRSERHTSPPTLWAAPSMVSGPSPPILAVWMKGSSTSEAGSCDVCESTRGGDLRDGRDEL